MSKSSIAHDPVLLRDTLTIKKIICFASGAPWPPPADELWDGIQADLKDACSQGDLPYSKNHSDQHRRFYSIRLHDLRRFLDNQDQRWQPLRDFCRRWADARGDTQSLGADEQADSGSRTVAKKTETEQRDKEIYTLFKATSAAKPRLQRGKIYDTMRVDRPDLFMDRRQAANDKKISDQRVDRIIREQQGQQLRRFAAS